MYPAEQISEAPRRDDRRTHPRRVPRGLHDELPHSLALVVDGIEYPRDNESGQAYDGKARVLVSIYVGVIREADHHRTQRPSISCASRRSCARRSTASSAQRRSSTCTSGRQELAVDPKKLPNTPTPPLLNPPKPRE